MSLIVEALRKAQLERDADVSRPAIKVHHEKPGDKTRWLILSVAIALVGLVMTGAYLFATGSSQQAHTAFVAEKAPEMAPPATAEPAIPSPAMPPHEQPLKTAATTPARKHDDGQAMPLQAMLARPPAPPVTIVTAPAADTTNISITTSASGHVEVISSDNQHRAAGMELSEDEFANAPMLYDLPAEVQARLPALELSIHVYSDNPAERFAYINSNLYHEGATVAEDITLVRITPKGAVLRNGEIVFRLML
jgi:general secretion pathway protein B